jgi:acetyl esterase/lipase
MLSKTTHTYAHTSSGDLKLDVYLPPDPSVIDISVPAFIYFHGGGLVAYSREFIPIHMVQSCIRRNWPLISVDYNLLPQAKGKDLVSNIQDAYTFVREKLSEIVGISEGLWEKIVIGGNSAGILEFNYSCRDINIDLILD